jgi:hypothetical protein
MLWLHHCLKALREAALLLLIIISIIEKLS